MVKIDEDGNTFCCWSCTGLLVMMTIPMTLVILGAYHIDDCPMEPKIPIFMIVSGVASILFIAFLFCANIYGKWNRANLTKCSIAVSVVMYLFIFAWNLAGAYWVFKEWNDWEGETSNSCHGGSYLFIFSLSIIYWILLPLNCFGFFKRSKDLLEDV